MFEELTFALIIIFVIATVAFLFVSQRRSPVPSQEEINQSRQRRNEMWIQFQDRLDQLF